MKKKLLAISTLLKIGFNQYLNVSYIWECSLNLFLLNKYAYYYYFFVC